MLICVVVARSLGNFGALILSNSVALSLILILSLCYWHLLALLLGYRVTHLPGNLPFNLVLDNDTHLIVIVLCDLFVLCCTVFFIFCVAHFLGNTTALLSGNILTVLLRYTLTILLGYLVAHLLGLAVTLDGWYYSSYSLLNIFALFNWHWATNRLNNLRTFLLIFIISVGNLDSVALFSVHNLAVLLLNVMAFLHGHILTHLGRNSLAHISGLIPTFLTWLIPALFLSIVHNTLCLSYCCTLLFSNSSANFLMRSSTLSLSNSVTLRFPDRGTFLLFNSLTLL